MHHQHHNQQLELSKRLRSVSRTGSEDVTATASNSSVARVKSTLGEHMAHHFTPIDATIDISAFLPYLPPQLSLEILRLPQFIDFTSSSSSSSPSSSLLSLSIPSFLPNIPVSRRPEYEHLIQAWFEVSAPYMFNVGPAFVDIWRTHIPGMALASDGSQALLEAMLALSSLQTAYNLNNYEQGLDRAAQHYHTAVALHAAALGSQSSKAYNDSKLATSLLLALYELWSGGLVKLGLHMIGTKNIAFSRDKESAQTPVGRTLFAYFVRIDVQTSIVSGNPAWCTDEWSDLDPLAQMTVPSDAPMLLVADAALAKLCLINAKITHLKRWSAMERTRLSKKFQADRLSAPSIAARKLRDLQSKIQSQVSQLEGTLSEWSAHLPSWFKPLKDSEDVDLNDDPTLEITPLTYPHQSVALLLSMADSAVLQLYRIANPESLVAPTEIGSRACRILRAFISMAATRANDVAFCTLVFVAGLELRHASHRKWLMDIFLSHFHQFHFPIWPFFASAVTWAWQKLEGSPIGEFQYIKGQEEDEIEGVSKNLWRAEGVTTMISSISLEDSDSSTMQSSIPASTHKNERRILPSAPADYY